MNTGEHNKRDNSLPSEYTSRRQRSWGAGFLRRHNRSTQRKEPDEELSGRQTIEQDAGATNHIPAPRFDEDESDSTEWQQDGSQGDFNGEGGNGESSKTSQSKSKEPQTTKFATPETKSDSENEYHLAIINHDWEALEVFVKSFDHTKYKAKPVIKKRKCGRKLRIAKYLPDNLEDYMFWKREEVHETSPLLCLDEDGRTPLHLACIHGVPSKLLLRLLFVQRDAAGVVDTISKSLPLHIAIEHERNLEVIDKLIRGYPQGSWQPDGQGRTPLVWAVEMARRIQLDENPPVNSTYWGFPVRQGEAEWQMHQERIWSTVLALLENRDSRRKSLIPPEYKLIVQSLATGAPPAVIQFFVVIGKAALELDDLAGPALSLCISRQYPVKLLKELIDAVSIGLPKLYKDTNGRGLVSLHYKVGCVVKETADGQTSSFRMTMQQAANAMHPSHHEAGDELLFDPPAPYVEWWEKLQFLISLWGSHEYDDVDNEELIHEELLLHNALSNSDAPPSLIQLLAALYPHSTELEHPRTHALPIHLACRVWRYRTTPPRKGEKEIGLDKVVTQLLDGDSSRCRKRYKDRLPLHHAIAAGKPWDFIKPLVSIDRRSLHQRDPSTKLYPFQLAAGRPALIYDKEAVTKSQFTTIEWSKMREWEQDHEIRKLDHLYELEQLTVIFECLRHGPDAINPEVLKLKEAARIAASPAKRPKLQSTKYNASDQVIEATLNKILTSRFSTGRVSSHFVAFCYEKTRRGWKTHRFHMANVKEAIMDGFIPTNLDVWWRKLKIWIWHDCSWDSIPRRDDFLLHAALCNRDSPVQVIALILECFPRSASIPLPDVGGDLGGTCFPLHIACCTDQYLKLPFEVAHDRSVMDMLVEAYPDAVLMKWNRMLPLHLAITRGKNWDELQPLVESEPMALAIPTHDSEFYAFQRVALCRPYSDGQRARFQQTAINRVGPEVWSRATAPEKVKHMTKVLHVQELNTLTTIWQLLRANPEVISCQLVPMSSVGDNNYDSPATPHSLRSLNVTHDGDGCLDSEGYIGGSMLDLSSELGANLSTASLDFLEELFEKGAMRDKLRNSTSSLSNSSGTIASSGGGRSRQRMLVHQNSGSTLSDDELPSRSHSSIVGDEEREYQARTRRLLIDSQANNRDKGELDFLSEVSKPGDCLSCQLEACDTRGLLSVSTEVVTGGQVNEDGFGIVTTNYGNESDRLPSAICASDASKSGQTSNHDDLSTCERNKKLIESEVGIALESGGDDPDFSYEYEEVDPNISSEEEESHEDLERMDDEFDAKIDENSLGEVKDEGDDIEFEEHFEEDYGEGGDYDEGLDRLSTIPEEDSSHIHDDSVTTEEGETIASRRPSNLGAFKSDRRAGKDLIVVTESDAFVLWKQDALSSTEFRKLSPTCEKNSWVDKLRSVGEEVDLRNLCMLRFEKNQTSVAATVVDNETIFVDHDSDYVWVLCGARAASMVSNYDVISTFAVLAPKIVGTTDRSEGAVSVSESGAPYSFCGLATDRSDMLQWLWATMAKTANYQSDISSQAENFELSRIKVLDASSDRHLLERLTSGIRMPLFDEADRCVSFSFRLSKLRANLVGRNRIPATYFVSRTHQFYILRRRLLLSFAKVKFWDTFKQIQKKGKVPRRIRRGTRKKSVLHSANVGQPGVVVTNQNSAHVSPHSNLLRARGDAPKPLCKKGERVADVMITKFEYVSDASKLKENGAQLACHETTTWNQRSHHWGEPQKVPSFIERNDRLAGIAAAHAMRCVPTHNLNLNQPMSPLYDDESSLDVEDVFDPLPLPKPKNPLLAAALKAKQVQERRDSGDTYRSTFVPPSENSLNVSDVFTSSNSKVPKQPPKNVAPAQQRPTNKALEINGSVVL